MRPTRYSHTGIHAFEQLDKGKGKPAPDDGGDETVEIEIPQDDESVQALSDDDLDPENPESLAATLAGAFDAMEDVQDAESLAKLSQLADGIRRLSAEKQRREDERANVQAEAQKLRDEIRGTNSPDAEDGDDGGGDGDEGVDDGAKPAEAPKAPTAEPTSEQAIAAAAGPPNVTVKQPVRLNVPLSEIRRRAPQPAVAPRLAITAAADVPKVHAGHQFESVSELATAFHERAKSAALTASGEPTGPKVATIHRKFEHSVSVNTSESQMADMIKDLTDVNSLVAAGGWCAPSEISYDFFDITCEDGMIDLPTFGVTRGGIRWPVSPGLSDVFNGAFSVTTNPWLWTETDDILAVTGTGVKPCVRVPCPTFTEARLEDYGICVTAGNLTDAAFPEAIEHQLGLLQSAQYHVINGRYLALMVAMSTPVATGGMFNDAGAFSSDLLAAAEWAAIDYRTRHGMCEGAVLEMVLPKWARAPFRTDMSQRTGQSELDVSNAQIDTWLDRRGVRAQWVNDWQVRGTNQPGGATATALYPLTVQFMIYAAGTFGLGNGPTLDLGVVRDSTLNAKNDHTAMWAEEAHLVAKFGNESRLYTVAICAAGRTGIANLADCRTA